MISCLKHSKLKTMLLPRPRLLALALALLLLLRLASPLSAGDVIHAQAKDTLTAVELDPGDELRFSLQSGRVVRILLDDTRASIVERVHPGGIIYRFSCCVRIDGQALELRRLVCSQECFYEPYVIDGLRIWPDIVGDVFDLIPVRYPHEGNLRCRPRKAARLAVQDATLRICPQETQPWLDEQENFIDIGRCYNGDDCYLGPYLGQACHVGMDINHPKGSPLFAPVDFGTQAYFNSLAAGDNNNRWRGIRRWPNGDVWALQTHHLIDLLVPQHVPIEAGTRYATTAGVAVGSHQHTHFEFKVGRKTPGRPLRASGDPASIACPVDFDDQSEAAQTNPEVLHLDPWIVFWQTFEDRKARHNEIRAAMEPLAPTRPGQPVAFSAAGSRGAAGGSFCCYWAFGDGGFGTGQETKHVFARAGVYPVTLVVDDGHGRATHTQHIVVDGEPVSGPALVLDAPEEPSFRRRPVYVADVYGCPVERMPHTLRFVARATRRIPDSKLVRLGNSGSGDLPQAELSVEYVQATDWLRVASVEPQTLEVGVDAGSLGPGLYTAQVAVDCPGALNSPQRFRVQLDVRSEAPLSGAVVDDCDEGFYATPYFWVGHRFCRVPPARRGHNGFYLTNGADRSEGEFVRFQPDLEAGTYRVSFSEATPFGSETEFDVRVRHRSGESVVRVCPAKSRRVGEFEFSEGTDGYLEIAAGGSKGLVIADAAMFERR